MEGTDNIESLRALIAALRQPQSGSPWDIKQDFHSLAPYTIEEAYEVLDAVYRGNRPDLCEELGDLLLQIIYYARLAEEEGSFDFNTVVQALTAKLTRRHPHIFGENAAKPARLDLAAHRRQWQSIKEQEKAAKGQAPVYSLDTVSPALPPVLEAAKLQQQAEAAGFDWVAALPVLHKVQEELAELQEAIEKGDKAEQSAEYGDVLFTLINLGRKIGVAFEAGLKQSNQKFRRRFTYIEKSLRKQHKSLTEADISLMEKLWNEAKEHENSAAPS